MDYGRSFAGAMACIRSAGPPQITEELEQEITEQTEGLNPQLPPFAPVEMTDLNRRPRRSQSREGGGNGLR